MLGAQGITATQGTLSRDLQEMGVVKGAGGYALPPMLPPTDSDGELKVALRTHCLAVHAAMNLVVLRTQPGGAQPLGIQIDRRPIEGIVGCVAGDDTILVATTSVRAAQQVAKDFARIGGLD